MTDDLPLRGIIFDLGGTLLDFSPGQGWYEMEMLGAEGWHKHLHTTHPKPPPRQALREAVWAQMREAWYSIGQGNDHRLDLATQLSLAAERLPLALDKDDLLHAVDHYIKPVQAQLELIDGAHEVLGTLKQRGYRLGLISNTMWPGSYHRADLARFGLLDYFAPDALFFSADEAVWKPDPAIFHRALAALDLRPQEAAFIGDNLVLDIQGAQAAGMRGVWVAHDDPHTPEALQKQVKPDASFEHLTALLNIVEEWT